LVNVEGAELVETVEEETPPTPATPATTSPPDQKATDQKTTEEKPTENEGETKPETKEQTEQTPKEGEAKSESKPTDSKTEKPSTSSQPPAKKKKVLKSELQVKAENKHSISLTQLQKWQELELQFIQNDKLISETAEAKNGVESYVYNMRAKLNGPLSEFATSNDKESFLKTLSETEEWLYGEGEEATKSVYQGKLANLRSIGDQIENRLQESQNRYSTLDSVRKSVSSLKLSATSAVRKRNLFF
jgi:hypothetical protein